MFKKLPEWVTEGAEILIQFAPEGYKPFAERATIVKVNRRHVISEVAPGHRFTTQIADLVR